MHPLVQSALEAANRGENNKAMGFLKQALAANPNDVDAWLVVAAVVEQPERKRQCLNRVLSLDPTNQIARDELLDMDHAAMGGAPLFVPDPAPVSQPAFQSISSPSNDPSGTSAFESVPAPKRSDPAPLQTQGKASPKPSAKTSTDKPLAFKYPLFWRILMYFFLVVFGCLAVVAATQDILGSLPVFGIALLMGIGAMTFPKVEISEAGIRASGMFSSSEANWGDIKSIKSNTMKRRLELFKSNGQVVKVSTQVSGYPRIVEILRQKRPDLFGMTASSVAPGNMFTSGGELAPSSHYGSLAPAPAFSGTKIFQKSFFKQYGSYLIVLPLCLFAAWTAFTEPANRIGASIAAVFCVAMMIFPLFQVSSVKVEPNKLTIETLFEQKVFSAPQIREIKMQTVRGRYGTATNFVNIIPVQGKNYPLGGFSAGDEVIYGFLTNWWNTYRNR